MAVTPRDPDAPTPIDVDVDDVDGGEFGDAGLDLTPRPAAGGRPAPRRRRNPWALGVVALVLLGLGFVVIQGLGNAVTYYYNADEAVKQKAEIGDRRIRVQGMVVAREDGDDDSDVVAFTIRFEGVEIDVLHRGDPPEMFELGIPVVLEGRWDGQHFASDKMLIKHSSEYKAENPDRVSKQDP